MRTKVIAIVGPTASGKSALAVLLARKYGGEVISADSRQVYKGLDVGSGKVTKTEMKGIPHHLLSIVDHKKPFSVSEYKKLAEKALQYTVVQKKLPIVVGGTGLYIDTLLQGLTFPEVAPDPKLRALLEKESTKTLFTMLHKLDANRAKTIDKNNPRRLIRAIEIARVLGKVPKLKAKDAPWHVLYIGLLPSPENLKKNIETRLQKRVAGIVREVQKLHKGGLSWKRMEELGLEYRYGARYAQGFISKQQMIEHIEKESYQYAKRQMTWFKRNKAIHWFDPSKKSSQKLIEKLTKSFVAKNK